MLVYNFLEGQRFIINTLEKIITKPKIIAIYGIPDSGKTYLIDSLGEYYEKMGLKTKQRENKEKINLYETWAFYDSFHNQQRIREEWDNYDIIMFHCPWDNRSKPWERKVDPEESVKLAMNRNLDISIGIYNPKRSKIPIGYFDIVIKNPDSSEKPWNFDD